MRKFFAIAFATLVVAVSGSVTPAHAADYCFCYPAYTAMQNVAKDQAKNGTAATPADRAACYPIGQALNCNVDNFYSVGDAPRYTCEARDTKNQCQGSLDAYQKVLDTNKSKFSIVGLVTPACLLDPVLKPECRNIDLFIILMINFGNWLFSIIGAVALGVFVYGGFNIILSDGNSEKVQTGIGYISGGVVGLGVAFFGYLLIQFAGKSLGVNPLYLLS